MGPCAESTHQRIAPQAFVDSLFYGSTAPHVFVDTFSSPIESIGDVFVSGCHVLLSSQPTPEQILAIRPSPEFQARVSDLLYHSKQGELSRQEESDLDRYLLLEHIVRLAKARAYQQTAARSWRVLCLMRLRRQRMCNESTNGTTRIR